MRPVSKVEVDVLSKSIRLWLRHFGCHVNISCRKQLGTKYSMQKKHEHNPWKQENETIITVTHLLSKKSKQGKRAQDTRCKKKYLWNCSCFFICSASKSYFDYYKPLCDAKSRMCYHSASKLVDISLSHKISSPPIHQYHTSFWYHPA